MDVDKIRRLLTELATFMRENGLSELDVSVGDTEVKMRKAGAQAGGPAVAQVPIPIVAPVAIPTPAAPAAAPAAPAEEPGTVTINSPMVGTFYRTPKPDADPFVDVGDEVSEDTVLCIIEAMKVMNEIKAERRGRVVRILVENGEPVEYGQPLFQIAAGPAA